MIAVPAAFPITTPDDTPTTARVLLELQVPPAVTLLSVIAELTQTVVGPTIGLTVVFTVIVLVATPVPQLLVTTYDIVTVPAVIPTTVPEELTVALVLLALHDPPDTGLVNVIESPVPTVDGPLIMPASGVLKNVNFLAGVA
jgi:hypothetical protein